MYGLPPQPRRMLDITTEPAGIVLLAVVISLRGIAIVVVLTASQWLDRLAKIEKAVQGLPVLCATPARPGDRTIITLHHLNGQIDVRCHATTDWRHPERILK